jgi:hypothetical protein
MNLCFHSRQIYLISAISDIQIKIISSDALIAVEWHTKRFSNAREKIDDCHINVIDIMSDTLQARFFCALLYLCLI